MNRVSIALTAVSVLAACETPDQRPEPSTPVEAAAQPASEDLVFCAFGGSGTDSAAARAAAGSIAELAPSGPLDFVLLPGDNFAPSGVTSTEDPQWQSKFEQLFDVRRLAVPFYPAPGAADHQGDLYAQVRYGVFNTRWTMANHTYQFAAHSHGTDFTFVALDTPSILGPLGIARNRYASRSVTEALQAAPPGWKIVFGHHRVFEGAEPSIRERDVDDWLRDQGVDLYIAGGAPGLEIGDARASVLQVVAGQVVAGQGDSGFAWFRYDGRALEISLYSPDGNLRKTHRMTKP